MKRRTASAGGTLLYAALFLACLYLLLRRLPYGAALDDEAFYLTVPWQMSQGSSLVLHQWNTAQLFGFLLWPPVALYRRLNPGAEGIFLHFRLIFLACHALMALLLRLRLKHKSRPGSAAVSLIYLAFVFRGLPCLSYNTMGVGLLILAGLTLGLSRGKAWEYLLAGLALAGAVLCCPYLAVLYLLYSLAVLVLAALKRSENWDGVFSGRAWLLFTAGCGILAALFFLRIALYGGLRLLPGLIPLLLAEDPNQLPGLIPWLRDFYRTLAHSNSYFRPVLLGSLALTAALLLDRGRARRRWLYLLLAAALTLLYSLTYLLMYRGQNNFIFPLSILGFFAFLLCRREGRLFAFLYLPGLVYWLCIDLASDLGFSSIYGASAVNMVPSVLVISLLAEELWRESRETGGLPRFGRLAAAALSVAAVCLLTLASLRFTFTSDANGLSRWADDTRITCGAARGLIADAQTAADYETEYAALAPLREKTGGNVLYLTRNSLRFLEDPKRCVSSNLWFSFVPPEKGFEQLRQYWEIFPDRRPDEVYLPWELIDRGYLEGFAPYPHSEEPVETGVILHMDWSAS